jgi:hypothetical protein
MNTTQDSRTSFVLSVPGISLTFHLAALQNVLRPGFASAQMLRDADLNSSSRRWIPTRTLRALHTFLAGLVKCAWHEANSIWEKNGKLFFIRTGFERVARSRRALRLKIARTELNALYTANDPGDPRIINLRTDEEQVIGELCQSTNLNYRARHGGCLTQVGVRGRMIQRTRLTEGLTVSLIGVCMKVGAAGFLILFVIALLFPSNLLAVQQYKDLTGAADPYTDVFARASTF